MENTRTTLGGFGLSTEFVNVPIGFVNALRRICLTELPAVVLSNIEILDNSSQLTHEMIRHRVSMIPLNVTPEETGVIRDTRVELRFLPHTEAREITTDDFMVAGPRGNLLLKDRDLETPLFFMKLNANESIHIKATLSIEPKGQSHVCVSTFNNHIDPDRAKVDRDTWTAKGGDPREFDNFHIQRSYVMDENGRPTHFDFRLESIGALKAKDILTRAATVLKTKVDEFIKEPIQRQGDGWYVVEMPNETYTLGQMAQEIIYGGDLVDFVSRDTGHPLIPKLQIRFHTKHSPEDVIQAFHKKASALCESILQ
jgi:DNA-directed RNA polymerase alpha subunit